MIVPRARATAALAVKPFEPLAAKARALLHKRYHATTADVQAMMLPVLRHRIIPTFNAEASGTTTDDIIREVDEVLRGKATKAAPARSRAPARGAGGSACGT